MPLRRQRASEIRRILAAIVALAIMCAMVVAVALAVRPGAVVADSVTIPMGNTAYNYYPYYWFCDSSYSGYVCTTTIQVGDTVTWRNDTTVSHTSTDSPVWDSGPVAPSGTYSRQFNQAGVFDYHCSVHPTQMLGRIVVEAATSTPTPTPTRTPLPAVGGFSLDPPPATSGSSGPGGGLAAGIAGGTAAAVALGGAAWWARRRNHIP